ncbi:MAG TPA: NINE protein [Tepidisphaeraceae bacterium]|nr:NINE protein [Tepidisphaeraceae bacterium]
MVPREDGSADDWWESLERDFQQKPVAAQIKEEQCYAAPPVRRESSHVPSTRCIGCGERLHNQLTCHLCGTHYCSEVCLNRHNKTQHIGSLPTFAPHSGNRLAAGILAILLGEWGVHKFVIGCPLAGILMLLISSSGFFFGFFTCGLTFGVSALMKTVGVVEGVIYLTKSDEDFYATYTVGRRPWF